MIGTCSTARRHRPDIPQQQRAARSALDVDDHRRRRCAAPAVARLCRNAGRRKGRLCPDVAPMARASRSPLTAGVLIRTTPAEAGKIEVHIETAGPALRSRQRQGRALSACRTAARDCRATFLPCQDGKSTPRAQGRGRRQQRAGATAWTLRRQMPPSVAARPTALAAKPGASAGRDRRPTDAAQAPVSLLARASRGNAARHGRVPTRGNLIATRALFFHTIWMGFPLRFPPIQRDALDLSPGET
jgi:hypothetical protein